MRNGSAYWTPAQRVPAATSLVVLIALSTGFRKGEILNLQWPDVDLIQGRITSQETKNGERRTVPLTGPALDQMRQHARVRRRDTQLVFPNAYGTKPLDIRKAWETALKQATIPDFRFHDLRHSAASYLAMNGASLAEIAEILGHKTLAMVKRYAHLSEAHTAGVVARMNAKIFGESR
jgi:integrase